MVKRYMGLFATDKHMFIINQKRN